MKRIAARGAVLAPLRKLRRLIVKVESSYGDMVRAVLGCVKYPNADGTRNACIGATYPHRCKTSRHLIE